jgi:hypothetical protein
VSASNALRAVAAFVLALALTWPMPLDPVGTIVGLEEATAACHVWILWWARTHLGELDTTLLFHPHGGDVMRLYGSDVLSPLLLSRLPGPLPLLYNGWVLFLLTLGGVGAARLATRAGAGPGGAWVALAVFEAAPFFRHELLNGTAELLGAAFLPWFAAALIDVLDAPDTDDTGHGTMRAGLVAGLWGLLAALCSVYNLFFVFAVGLVLLLHRLATRLEPILSGARLRALVAGAGIGAAGLAALLALHLRHGALDTLRARGQAADAEPPLPDAFADPSQWLDPRRVSLPVWLTLPEGGSLAYWTTATVHLGFVAVIAALVGAFTATRASRARSAVPWWMLLVVGLLVATGPTLRWAGERVLLAGGPVPMPSATLAALLPGFAVTAPHAYRYATLVVLALSVLAARAARGPGSGALLATLVAIECLVASPVPFGLPVTPVRSSPVLEQLSAMPDGAVLTAPTRKDDLHDLGRAMLAQTVHGKPMQDGGMHHRADPESLALFVDNPLVDALAARGARTLPEARTTRASVRALGRSGYRYLLVAVEESDVRAWVGRHLGPPRSEDDRWALWTLDALPAGPQQGMEAP